ncbi:MAG: transcriptional repressor NrdR [Alphaproteobacteria bacterium]|nr:transcriptional repressor NrdR [Alphaproteobacteria bacterium]NCQ88163.1 transcriptional repressor NrdR [Alphaproteobacteria bacterium]NCT05330.1 transcriptional repressor NrdR [Alphaproteobacteria bacterium]
MLCPFCNSEDTQVKDSRPAEDNTAIRRRRACNSCGGRYTTYERVQLRDLIVIKSDGRLQAFDRDKIIRSMSVALRKRPVEMAAIEKAATGIVRQLESEGEQEVAAGRIGDLVMNALIQLDLVGYIRYTSVYKDFRNPEDFNAFLENVRELQAQQK